MNVTLPDGTTVQNIPDGTTKAQLAEKLKANGMNVPKEWLAPTAAAAPTTAKQRAQSFVSGLNLPNAEKDPGMRAFEQGAVPEAGGPGAALKAVGKAVPNAIKQPIAAGADWLDQALGNLKSKVARPTAESKAADIIKQSASDYPQARADIAQAARNPKPLVKGGRNTTAAGTSDEGLLGLEKTVRNLPGASERAGREIAAPNNTARSNVIGAMAGDADKVAAAKAARAQATNELYRQADTQYVNVDKSFRDLMERPSIKSAIKKAEQLAREAGEPLQPGDLPKSLPAPGSASRAVGAASGGARPSAALQVSGKGLHYVKLALDNMIDGEGRNALAKEQKRLITKTRDDFLKWTEERVPAYKQARETFRDMSKPINRMELMQRIQAKATSNATDAAGNKIVTRNGYQNAIKQYRKELERTMTPAQLKHIDQVSRDLDNAEKVNSPYIKPAGSETIRHANAQSGASMLGKLTGGHGATAALTHLISVAPGFGWLRGVPPEQVREVLINAMLDPKTADQLLAKATPANLNKLSDTLKGAAAELGITDGSQIGRAAVGLAQPPAQQAQQ